MEITAVGIAPVRQEFDAAGSASDKLCELHSMPGTGNRFSTLLPSAQDFLTSGPDEGPTTSARALAKLCTQISYLIINAAPIQHRVFVIKTQQPRARYRRVPLPPPMQTARLPRVCSFRPSKPALSIRAMSSAVKKERVWDYPRPPACEPTPKRIRVYLKDVLIADTTNAYRILETTHPPTYYIPPQVSYNRTGGLAGMRGRALLRSASRVTPFPTSFVWMRSSIFHRTNVYPA